MPFSQNIASMTQNLSKDMLRNHYKLMRKALSQKRRALYSEQICSEILSMLPTHTLNIHIFLPIISAGEVDLRPLLAPLWQRGDRLYIPRMKGNELEHIRYTPDTTLVTNHYHISEPAIYHTPASTEEIAQIHWALTPLLLCDLDGYRVGYGGGFYDRFFQQYPHMTKIGVGFFEPIPRITDRYAGDIALDHYIMPGKRITFQPTR